MDFMTITLIALVFLAIQISIWQMFPVYIRELCFANPVFGFIVNLAGSSFISSFTGVASMVGIANMFASVLFAGYALWYKKQHHIVGLGCEWVKLFGLIPVLPKLKVIKEDKNTNGGE